jgi:phosphohistidine phosphatase
LKELLLFRHAKSSWATPGQDDHERPLNGRGRRAAALMAGWMLREGWRPDLVLCSSAVRTRETVAIAMQTLPIAQLLTESGLYLASAARLRQRVREVDDAVARLMLVAHNPGIEELARALDPGGAAEGSGPHAKYPTAGCAWFRSDARSWRSLFEQAPVLVAFMTPGTLTNADDD